MRIAVWQRRLQFRAGPQSTVFHACADASCKSALERADVGTGLFFGRITDVMEPVDPDDEIPCDVCREG